jgi:hypothetical protein
LLLLGIALAPLDAEVECLEDGGGSHFHCWHRGFYYRCLALGARVRSAFEAVPLLLEPLLGFIISVLIAVYLLYTRLRPDRLLSARMTFNSSFQILIFSTGLLALSKPLGVYC